MQYTKLKHKSQVKLKLFYIFLTLVLRILKFANPSTSTMPDKIIVKLLVHEVIANLVKSKIQQSV